MTLTQPDTRNAPIAFWRIARWLIEVLFSVFGSPSEVACSNVLMRKMHRQLNEWLNVAEALVRHLLLIEASHVNVPPASSRQTLPAGEMPAVRQRKRRLIEFHPDKSEDWIVHFHCFPTSGARDLRSRISSLAANAPPEASRSQLLPGLHNSWPLALRYEALLRAYNNPAPYARRLAHRLRAHPHRAIALRHQPAHFHTRVDRADAITGEAEKADAKFRDSS